MLGILRKIPYPLLPFTAKTCEFLFLRQIPLNKIILFPYSCHPQSAELGGPVFANSVVSSMNGCLGGWMVVSWIRIRQRCHSALDWLKSWQEKEGGKGAVEKVEKKILQNISQGSDFWGAERPVQVHQSLFYITMGGLGCGLIAASLYPTLYSAHCNCTLCWVFMNCSIKALVADYISCWQFSAV